MKHLVVIDTNVIVSSIFSPSGNPFRVMELVASEAIKPFYSSAILEEYKRVLAYPKFKFRSEIQSRTIQTIKRLGKQIEPPNSTIPLPDETDRIFYDTAKASEATLVTGNIKHYPSEPFVMAPFDFLRRLGI